jgi:hypothetical protein
MNQNTNMWGWVIGIVVAIIVIGGIWWAVSANNGPGTTTDTSAAGTQLEGTPNVPDTASTTTP